MVITLWISYKIDELSVPFLHCLRGSLDNVGLVFLREHQMLSEGRFSSLTISVYQTYEIS